jgi:polo-like kinase 1
MIGKKDEDHKGIPQSASPDLVIIEERGAHSDQPIKRYSKGKLLGKVSTLLMQGGFAKCYEFTSLDTNKLYAAKVIEKSSLSRSKAKEKVFII